MSPSHAEVTPTQACNATRVGSTDVRSTESADVGRAETTDVGSAEATHVTSTRAAHVAATMTPAATAAGLRTRSDEAAGEQRSCQNHHPSSIHYLSPLEWAGVPPQDVRQTLARIDKANADVATDSQMGFLVRRPY